MKTSFWGKSLEVKALGYQNVRFKHTKEHFTIDRPSSSVQNIIFGDMYIEHYGNMTVKNHLTHEYAIVEFKKRGWGNKGAFEIEGFVFNANKEKKYRLWGKWI